MPRPAGAPGPLLPSDGTALRNTTGVELDDDDWFELARELLDITGIEPDGDSSACRWVAMRNQAGGLDIVATVIC